MFTGESHLQHILWHTSQEPQMREKMQTLLGLSILEKSSSMCNKISSGGAHLHMLTMEGPEQASDLVHNQKTSCVQTATQSLCRSKRGCDPAECYWQLCLLSALWKPSDYCQDMALRLEGVGLRLWGPISLASWDQVLCVTPLEW